MNQESLNASRKIDDYLGLPSSNVMSIDAGKPTSSALVSIETQGNRNNLTSLDTTKNISDYNKMHQISNHPQEHFERIQFINNKLQGLQDTKLEIRNRVQKKLREDIQKINVSSGLTSQQAISHASLTKVRSSQDQEFRTFGVNTNQRVDTTGSPDKKWRLNYNYDPTMQQCHGLFPVTTTSDLKNPLSVGNFSTVSLQNQNQFLNPASGSTTSPTNSQPPVNIHPVLNGHSVSESISGSRRTQLKGLNPHTVSNTYSGIGTVRGGALQPNSILNSSHRIEENSNTYSQQCDMLSGVLLHGQGSSFSPKSILSNGRNSNQIHSKNLSYRQTDYNLPLQYAIPKSLQVLKAPTPIKEADSRNDEFSSQSEILKSEIITSRELESEHDFSMNIELFNKRLARIGKMKQKLQSQQEKLFESKYARELAEKLKDVNYQEIFKQKVENDQKMDEKLKIKEQFEEFVKAQQQYIEEQKLLNQQFPRESELNKFQQQVPQSLNFVPINVASGSSGMTYPAGMNFHSPQSFVYQNSQKIEPQITGQSEATQQSASFPNQQSGAMISQQNQQPQQLVPVFYNPQTGQIIENPQYQVIQQQNLQHQQQNSQGLNQCLSPVYQGAESMQNTSQFPVLSEQNLPQGAFSMGNTMNQNYNPQQEEIDAYEREYQQQMRKIEDQILILTNNSQALQQNKMAAQLQVQHKYAQIAEMMSSGQQNSQLPNQNLPPFAATGGQGGHGNSLSMSSDGAASAYMDQNENGASGAHWRSQSMQVENTNAHIQDGLDYINQSQELPNQIHEPTPQHKRCKTENNIIRRKRESRNSHEQIQKVLPVKLLKYKKGGAKGLKTQNQPKNENYDNEKENKRRMTQLQESPQFFFINQTTYQTMLSTPNGTIGGEGSQTRRHHGRNQAENQHHNQQQQIISGGGNAETMMSDNRRETSYGEESPKTQILIQTLKNVEKQLENIQIAQFQQNLNQNNTSGQNTGEQNYSSQTQQFQQQMSRPQTQTEHLDQQIKQNFLECQRSLSQIEIMKSAEKQKQISRSRSRSRSKSPNNSKFNSQSKASSIRQSPVNYRQGPVTTQERIQLKKCINDSSFPVLQEARIKDGRIQQENNLRSSENMVIQENMESIGPYVFSQDSSQLNNFISQNIVQEGNLSQEFYIPNNEHYTIDQDEDENFHYGGNSYQNQQTSVRQSFTDGSQNMTSQAVSPQKIHQEESVSQTKQHQIDPDDYIINQNDCSTVEAQKYQTREDLTITLGQQTIMESAAKGHQKKYLVASAAGGETSSEAMTDQESAQMIQFVPSNQNNYNQENPNYYIDFVQENKQDIKLLKSDPRVVNKIKTANQENQSSCSGSDLKSQISQRMLSQDQLYFKLIQQTNPENWKKLNTYCSTHRGRQSDNVLSIGTRLKSGGSIPEIKKGTSQIVSPCPEEDENEADPTEIYQSYGNNNLPINLNSHSSKSLQVPIGMGMGSSIPPISNNRMGMLSSNTKRSNLSSQKSFDYQVLMNPDPAQHNSLSPTNMMQFGFYNGTFDQEALPKSLFHQTYNKESDEKMINVVEQIKSNMMSLQPPETCDALTTEIDNTKRIQGSKLSTYSRPTSKTKRRPPIPKITQMPKGSLQSSVHTTQRMDHSGTRQHQKSKSSIRSGKMSETELASSNRALIKEIRDQNQQLRRNSQQRQNSNPSRQVAMMKHQTQ